MRSEGYMLNVACFMIFLIITIPIYSSSAFAATINPPVQVYGKDRVVGFRAGTDVTVVNVSVTSPEDMSLSQSQVKVLEDPTIEFSCSLAEEGSATFNCMHEYPETTLPGDFGVLDFTVQAFSDSGNPMSGPVQAEVVIDALPPRIIRQDYTPLPGGIVTADFSVKDEACTKPECLNKCAGVGSVKFTVAGLVVDAKTDFGGGCAQDGALNLSGLVVGGEVGTKHVCMEVTDKFGQSAADCKDVTLDTRPPQITGIGLFDSNGKPITFTNGKPIENVMIIVNITEDSRLVNPDNHLLQEDAIYVNASQISEKPEHQAALGKLKLDCSHPGEGRYTCSRSGLFLILTAPRTVSLKVKAMDEFQNLLDESRSIPITFDNTPPVATRFYSGFVDDKGDNWVREDNNTISLDITETGAGMANKNVFLDFSAWGRQELAEGISKSVTLLEPNSCVPGWTCTWNMISTDRKSGQSLYLTPSVGSKDDANNALQPATGSFRVDVDGPEAVDVNITAISDIGKMSFIASGDALEIHAYVLDHTPIRGFANFSEILPDMPSLPQEGDCVEFESSDPALVSYVDQFWHDSQQRMWDCSWSIGPIIEVPNDLERAHEATIGFSFMDILGNVGKADKDIDVLGKENVTPDYWVYSWLGQSPEKGIDRFTWGLSNPMSYQRGRIIPRFGSSYARIVSFEFDPTTCVGDIDYLYYSETGEAGVSFMDFDPDLSDGIDDVFLVELNPTNPAPATYTTEGGRSNAPRSRVTEEGVTYPLEDLYVNCTASIRSIVKGARVSMIENENLTFRISVYDNPLGENLGNVKQKVKDMEDAVRSGWWSWIKWPKMIFDYLNVICNAISTLTQVWGIVLFVASGAGAACEATGYFCSASQTANEAAKVQDKMLTSWIGKFNTACGLVVSCRATKKEAVCTSNDGWCEIARGYAEVNSWWTNLLSEPDFLSGSYLVPDDKKEAWENSVKGGFDPRKSLVSSLMTVCLPGIFSNIEKYRQMLCEWILCVKVNVAMGTMTIHECDELLRFTTCKYIMGDIWNALPITQYISRLQGAVRDAMKDPLVLAGYAIDITCSLTCDGVGTACSICMWTKAVFMIPQVAENVKGIKGMWESAGQDICEEALKDEPAYGNIGGFPREATEEQVTQQYKDLEGK